MIQIHEIFQGNHYNKASSGDLGSHQGADRGAYGDRYHYKLYEDHNGYNGTDRSGRYGADGGDDDDGEERTSNENERNSYGRRYSTSAMVKNRMISTDTDGGVYGGGTYRGAKDGTHSGGNGNTSETVSDSDDSDIEYDYSNKEGAGGQGNDLITVSSMGTYSSHRTHGTTHTNHTNGTSTTAATGGSKGSEGSSGSNDGNNDDAISSQPLLARQDRDAERERDGDRTIPSSSQSTSGARLSNHSNHSNYSDKSGGTDPGHHLSVKSNSSIPSNNSLYRSVAHFWTRSQKKKNNNNSSNRYGGEGTDVGTDSGQSPSLHSYGHALSPQSNNHSTSNVVSPYYTHNGLGAYRADVNELSLDDILINRWAHTLSPLSRYLSLLSYYSLFSHVVTIAPLLLWL